MENLAQPDTRKSLASLALVIVFFAFIFYFLHQPSSHVIREVQIGGVSVQVDLATTVAEQAQGLSGRPALASDHGMLFIFPKPAKYLFWMKDMNFPIDMIWLGEDLRVVYIKKNATPDSYPRTFGPDENSKYVLEVVSGFADKNNLQVGDSVTFH